MEPEPNTFEIQLKVTVEEGAYIYSHFPGLIDDKIKEKADELEKWLSSLDAKGKAQVLAYCDHQNTGPGGPGGLTGLFKDILGNRKRKRADGFYEHNKRLKTAYDNTFENDKKRLRDLCIRYNKNWEHYKNRIRDGISPNIEMCVFYKKDNYCNKSAYCTYAHSEEERKDFDDLSTRTALVRYRNYLMNA